MRDQGIWSISLGTWGGVRVRLHGLFLLFAALTAYIAWLCQQPYGGLAMSGGTGGEGDSSITWLAVASLAILWVSVLAHELGHLLTAVRLGGGADEVVLGPWGGLEPMQSPSDPRSELTVALSGPLVNLLLAVALCLPILIVHGVPVQELLNPLAPHGLLAARHDATSGGEWLLAVKLTFWINYVLTLVNMLPVFPFDGGGIARAGLMWWLPDTNRRSAGLLVARLAKLVAAFLLGAAWLSREQAVEGPVPVWLALTLLAGLVFFSARKSEAQVVQEPDVEEDSTALGYDFSEGYTSLERSFIDEETPVASDHGPVERWIQRRKASQLQRQREIEAEDDRRVDEVLARLHEVGLANLPDADRELLNRVSERYRSRQNRPTS